MNLNEIDLGRLSNISTGSSRGAKLFWSWEQNFVRVARICATRASGRAPAFRRNKRGIASAKKQAARPSVTPTWQQLSLMSGYILNYFRSKGQPFGTNGPRLGYHERKNEQGYGKSSGGEE